MNIERIYDTLADGYDAHFMDVVSIAENKAIFGWANLHLAGHIGDLGCGTGLVLEYLDIPPEQYTGIDVSRGMLAHAQTKFPDHRFIHADIQGTIPLDDSVFASVLMGFGTMSYCNAPHAVVREVMRVLQPNGRFFIMLCGEQYNHRQTHIINDIEQDGAYFKTYAPEETSKMFHRFTEVEITGFSPVNLNGIDDITEDIMLESRTVDAARMQDRYFLVVTGRKPDA